MTDKDMFDDVISSKQGWRIFTLKEQGINGL